MTAGTFLPSFLALAAVLALSRGSGRLAPRTAATLLAAGCVIAVTGADIAPRVALLQEALSPVGFLVTGASTAAAVTAAALAVTQVHHLVTLASTL